jgi:hypothetical protein
METKWVKQDIHLAPACIFWNPLYSFKELQEEATSMVMNKSASDQAMFTWCIFGLYAALNPSFASDAFEVVNGVLQHAWSLLW